MKFKDYNSIFSAMPSGFAYHRIILNKKGDPVDYVFLNINPAFERITGLKKEAVLGRKVTEIIPGIEHDPADWIGKYGVVALTGQDLKFDQYSRQLRKYFSVRAYSPKKGYFAVLFDEITKVRMEQQKFRKAASVLRTEKEILTAIMENTHAQTAYLDRNFNFIQVNSAYVKGAGIPEKKLIGKNHFDLFPDKENEVIFKKVRDSGKALEFRAKQFIFRNHPERGITYWDWILTPVKTKSRVDGLVLSLQDVTPHKKMEETLRSNLKSLSDLKHAIYNSSIVGISDRNGVIQYVNEKFETISKYSRRELIGKNFRLLNSGYHPKEFFSEMWKTITSGKVWRGEIRNKAKDGTLYWLDTTITPLLDEQGKPKQYISIRFDITDKKKLEQKKDEFISVASHELKTPLTSIKAFAQVLKRRFEKIGDRQSSVYLSRINDQIDRLTKLVIELLDTTRIQEGKLKLEKSTFSINDLIREVTDDISETTAPHRIFMRGKRNITVSADRDKISQVVTNLITNAVKYSPDSLPVTVRAEMKKRFVQVSITDRGIGIPESERVKIFDRFYQIKDSNTKSNPSMGLGLYISREIITRHGGRIWVESKQGEGSTFHFTLPQ